MVWWIAGRFICRLARIGAPAIDAQVAVYIVGVSSATSSIDTSTRSPAPVRTASHRAVSSPTAAIAPAAHSQMAPPWITEGRTDPPGSSAHR